MREAIGKAGPSIDIEQHVRDAGARQAIIKRLPDGLDRWGRQRAKWRDRQPRLVQAHIGQVAGTGPGRNSRCRLLKTGAALGQVVLETERDG